MSTEPQPLTAALENDIRELRGASPGELAARLIERGWTLDAARAVPALERCAPYGNPHPNGEPCPDCIAYGYAARAVPALDAVRLARAMAEEQGDFVGKGSLWTYRAEQVAAIYVALSDQQSKGET